MRTLLMIVGISAAVAGLGSLASRPTLAAPPAPGVSAPARSHPHFMAPGPKGGSSQGTALTGATKPPLLYHSVNNIGGLVQVGTHHTYAIYWGTHWDTSGNAPYKTLTNGFFANVAADSGKTSNVYFAATQYHEQFYSMIFPISYSEQFMGSWSDSSTPGNGCTATCVWDWQVRAEVEKAITAKGWPKGMDNTYFVFLDQGTKVCYDFAYFSCSGSQWCAYHHHYGTGANKVLYATIPYPDASTCQVPVPPPNANDADFAINLISREANGVITDPLGDAWYDADGVEIGDKCNGDYGSALTIFKAGYEDYRVYNQVINGTKYLLQGEWSNYSHKCVQTNK